jgi:hypothetical protein
MISKVLNNKKTLINHELNINFIELNAKENDKIMIHNKVINLISKLNK